MKKYLNENFKKVKRSKSATASHPDTDLYSEKAYPGPAINVCSNNNN